MRFANRTVEFLLNLTMKKNTGFLHRFGLYMWSPKTIS